MDHNRRAALFCAFVLLELKEVVCSKRGYCADTECFALYRTPTDFPGAQKSCEGPFYKYNSTQDALLGTLIGELSGRFWLEAPDSSEPAGESQGMQTCTSISVGMGESLTMLSGPCGEKLDGFLCLYSLVDPCGALSISRSAEVTYTVQPMGFQVIDSDTFPQGTIAEEVGGEFSDLKHLCYSGVWLQAPWNCDVMKGGCDYKCISKNNTQTCSCPAEQSLHPNNITCIKHPCSECAHNCHQVGQTHACTCRKGFTLAQDGRSCEDVDECKDDPCTIQGQDCENTQDGFACMCKYGFYEYNGTCVDVSICGECEHLCKLENGVYQCKCKNGYSPSSTNPNKCKEKCDESDCPADCMVVTEKGKKKKNCDCPRGYILNIINNTDFCSDIDECDTEAECDHCENLFGSYRCGCGPGFEQHNDECVPEQKKAEDEESGAGLNFPDPTPAIAHPASVPSYVKTGSILGITVFIGIFAVLLIVMLRVMLKRCGKFQLSSIKNHEIDIFYLQQVTTDKYKSLSSDRLFKNDSEIL